MIITLGQGTKGLAGRAAAGARVPTRGAWPADEPNAAGTAARERITMGRGIRIVVLTLITLIAIGATGAQAQEADLEVTLEADHQKVEMGKLFVYTISVTNHGPDAATDVTFGIEGLPDPVSMRCFSCGEGTPLPIGSALCSLGTLQPGGTATAVLVAAITNLLGGERRVTVTATASGPQSDPNPDDNSDSATVRVSGRVQQTLSRPEADGFRDLPERQ
jgi:hypothetical protein